MKRQPLSLQKYISKAAMNWLVVIVFSIQFAIFIGYPILNIRNLDLFPELLTLLGLVACFTPLIYWIICVMILPRFKQLDLSKRSIIMGISGSILIGFYFVQVIPLPLSFDISLRKVVIALCSSFSLGFVLFTISIFLIHSGKNETGVTGRVSTGSKVISNSTPKPSWWIYSLPMLAIWLIYARAFWPGLMSPDSYNIWKQAQSGVINNWHPVLNTLMVRWLSQLWNSPMSYVLTNTFSLALLASYGISRFKTYGLRRHIDWLIALLLALFPATGFMNITLWKDVPYSIIMFSISIMVFEVAMSQGAWLENRRNILLFSMVSILLCLFRHNGLPVIMLTLVALGLIFKQHLLKLIIAVISIICVVQLVNGPVYSYLGYSSDITVLQSQVALHKIAAHLKANTPVLPDEARYLNQLRPIDDDWNYNCYTSDTVIYNPNFNWSVLSNQTNPLADLYFLVTKLTLRNPEPTIKNQLCVGSLAFQIAQPKDAINSTVPIGFDENGSVISPATRLDLPSLKPILWLTNLLVKVWEFSRTERLMGFFWRPALFLYLLIYGTLIQSARRKQRIMMAIPIPALAQSLVLFVTSPTYDTRYYYPIVLMGLFFIPYLFLNLDFNSKR